MASGVESFESFQEDIDDSSFYDATYALLTQDLFGGSGPNEICSTENVNDKLEPYQKHNNASPTTYSSKDVEGTNTLNCPPADSITSPHEASVSFSSSSSLPPSLPSLPTLALEQLEAQPRPLKSKGSRSADSKLYERINKWIEEQIAQFNKLYTWIKKDLELQREDWIRNIYAKSLTNGDFRYAIMREHPRHPLHSKSPRHIVRFMVANDITESLWQEDPRLRKLHQELKLDEELFQGWFML
ncbi:uncharacterized protein LY89DRAFT_678316 [Mollisia scopiformis]|uniref:Uncharacterized protein n=1 Tax=Mollisia scopiformis TaxID=149040 RepID=A0A132B3Y2_MOLSC|nr:uncharacterized protein LY89DRAFT_678316 [Mollisia scopiformis]KUJ07041.1 hypothetical protein LY89DRAFT_678316 [Mollisia scopiformis]